MKHLLPLLSTIVLFVSCTSIPVKPIYPNCNHIDIIREDQIIYGEDYYFDSSGTLIRIDVRSYENQVTRSAYFSKNENVLEITTKYFDGQSYMLNYDFVTNTVKWINNSTKEYKIEHGPVISIFHNEIVLSNNLEVGFIRLLYDRNNEKFKVVIDIDNGFRLIRSKAEGNDILKIANEAGVELCEIRYPIDGEWFISSKKSIFDDS